MIENAKTDQTKNNSHDGKSLSKTGKSQLRRSVESNWNINWKNWNPQRMKWKDHNVQGDAIANNDDQLKNNSMQER